MLDAVDAALVSELQRNGRATFQALGARVGLSRTAARARVQRLLARGAVRVVGVVHAAVAGLAAFGHAAVDVEGPVRGVADAISQRRAASFVTVAAGHFPISVKLRTRDDAELCRELDAIRDIPGVRGLDVFRYADVVKDAHAPSLRLTPVTLDQTDRRLLQELQRDGRASYTRLAGIVGLSQAATRARVVRLIDSGAVRVVGLVDAALLGVRETMGFGAWVRGDATRVAARIAEIAGVHLVATGFGRFDVVGGVDARGHAALLDMLDAVHAVPGVTRIESWHHLAVLKESYAADLEVDPAPTHPGPAAQESAGGARDRVK